MVNDDVLIKLSRARGHSTTWPDQVNRMKSRMLEMKLGFPGIGNDHLTIVEYGKLKGDEIFIYDPYIESDYGDEAPMMLRFLPDSPGNCVIEGIGCGCDSERDPERIRFRWKDIIPLPPLHSEFLVYRVDPRPTMNGGPGYYYFFKSYRDFRR